MNSSCERALDRLADGEITFTRGAELTEKSPWGFASLVDDRELVWVSGDHIETDLEEL
ncbi:hypothetical protein [Halopiger goleimassiliensis]|uniref:hypothetical protein n=1 Tax=Halopiger goleimassiliensis TaxID=1293048 RepID=UPI000B20BDA9|nr:hypothetical protein [Halopiger goleimassiliensis]